MNSVYLKTRMLYRLKHIKKVGIDLKTEDKEHEINRTSALWIVRIN